MMDDVRFAPSRVAYDRSDGITTRLDRSPFRQSTYGAGSQASPGGVVEAGGCVVVGGGSVVVVGVVVVVATGASSSATEALMV